MSENDGANFGTRRLRINEDEPIVQPGEQTEPIEQPLPWVVELRVVGTASVLQVRIQRELIIGRSDPRFTSKPDIDLESYEGYQMGVSRRHAALFPKHNRVILRDLGSSNGTYINGRRLLQGQDYRVRHGDTLTIGKLQLQVFFAVMPSSSDQPDVTQTLQFEIPVIGSGQHILVIDPDMDVAQVFASVLEQAGFQVTIVRNAADAMTLMEEDMPGAVIMELMLPDISGLSLIQYIRNKPQGKSIPLVVVTSASAGFQMGQAIDAGVDIFLSKPVGVDELLRGLVKVAPQKQN